jgi:hypothetical protein
MLFGLREITSSTREREGEKTSCLVSLIVIIYMGNFGHFIQFEIFLLTMIANCNFLKGQGQF